MTLVVGEVSCSIPIASTTVLLKARANLVLGLIPEKSFPIVPSLAQPPFVDCTVHKAPANSPQ